MPGLALAEADNFLRDEREAMQVFMWISPVALHPCTADDGSAINKGDGCRHVVIRQHQRPVDAMGFIPPIPPVHV